MKQYRIACIPGDGIGKEVVPAGQAVLQALAQFADLSVVDAQQVFEAAVIQFGMAGAPVTDLAGELAFFAFQCVQALLLGLEFGGELH